MFNLLFLENCARFSILFFLSAFCTLGNEMYQKKSMNYNVYVYLYLRLLFLEDRQSVCFCLISKSPINILMTKNQTKNYYYSKLVYKISFVYYYYYLAAKVVVFIVC